MPLARLEHVGRAETFSRATDRAILPVSQPKLKLSRSGEN